MRSSKNLYNPYSTERSLFKGKFRKVMAGAALAAVVAGGAAETVHLVQENNKDKRAKYEATQAAIKPIIEERMIDIDKQAIAEHKAHPDKVIQIDAPQGHADAVAFMTGNARIIMGKTKDGQPDPAKPHYASYANNTGTGEGTRGMRFVMTAPEGNWQVDKDYSDFGGTTKGGTTPEGGWAASIGGIADTTYRGYANNSLPAPLEAAQTVAQLADEFKPFDEYK
jgi:hypothetical protein